MKALKTFKESYKDGTVDIDAIDDFVDEWHMCQPPTVSLKDFLGFTDEEYQYWVITGCYKTHDW